MNRTTRSAWILCVTIASVSTGVMACSSPPGQNDAQAPVAVSSQPQLQRYDLKGKVVSIDKPGKNVTVNHEDIPGFMGAMTMAYPVKDEHLLDGLSPGDQVTAKVVSGSGEVWLENIMKVDRATPAK